MKSAETERMIESESEVCDIQCSVKVFKLNNGR